MGLPPPQSKIWVSFFRFYPICRQAGKYSQKKEKGLSFLLNPFIFWAVTKLGNNLVI
jgi:hypothetical protein